MRKTLIVTTLAALVAFATAPARAQGSAQKKEPAPARSPAQELLDSWNEIGRKVTAMAEDFPEDKYDFKPNPAQRSFAEQLLHVAGSNLIFAEAARGQKIGPEDLPRSEYKTKADIAGVVKKSFADGAGVMKEKGAAGMAGTIKDPFANRIVDLSGLAWVLVEHSGEHYGQLVVYYRVSNLVPPESRPRK